MVFSWRNASLILLAALTLYRLIVGSLLPVSDDEAYYWLWSQHLAFGYVDHPPIVAWLIALGTFGGAMHAALFLRWPFILCEALAAWILGRATSEITRDERAAFIATAIFALIPETRLLIGQALPDPPYLLAWSVALFFALRLERTHAQRDALGLGIALGAALLSRFFGFALIGGMLLYTLMPAKRALLGKGFMLAFTVALIIYVPNLIWNATHNWVNFAFTVRDRQPIHHLELTRILALSTLRYAIYAALFWALAWWSLLRPRYALLAWTALPFTTILILLGSMQRVESYWLLGPFASLCVGLGIAINATSSKTRRTLAIIGSTVALTATAFTALAALPLVTQTALIRATHGALAGAIVDHSRAYAQLAHDLHNEATVQIQTQPYEIAAQLAYFGIPAELIDTSPQARQFALWPTTRHNTPCRIVITFATQSIGAHIAQPYHTQQMPIHTDHRTYTIAGQPSLSFTLRTYAKTQACTAESTL